MKQTTLSIIAMLILAVGYSQPHPSNNDHKVHKDSFIVRGLLYSDSIKRGFRMGDFTMGETTQIFVMMGGETVAYRKKDSSWVLINPDKTKIILDSIAYQKTGWKPVNKPPVIKDYGLPIGYPTKPVINVVPVEQNNRR